MNLNKRIEAMEEALSMREISLEEKELVKFFILAVGSVDLEQIDKIESILASGTKILNNIKDQQKQSDLIVELTREIIKDKDSGYIETLWQKFAKDLPLKWKNVS